MRDFMAVARSVAVAERGDGRDLASAGDACGGRNAEGGRQCHRRGAGGRGRCKAWSSRR